MELLDSALERMYTLCSRLTSMLPVSCVMLRSVLANSAKNDDRLVPALDAFPRPIIPKQLWGWRQSIVYEAKPTVLGSAWAWNAGSASRLSSGTKKDLEPSLGLLIVNVFLVLLYVTEY